MIESREMGLVRCTVWSEMEWAEDGEGERRESSPRPTRGLSFRFPTTTYEQRIVSDWLSHTQDHQ